jgi:hypothetical protein
MAIAMVSEEHADACRAGSQLPVTSVWRDDLWLGTWLFARS